MNLHSKSIIEVVDYIETTKSKIVSRINGEIGTNIETYNNAIIEYHKYLSSKKELSFNELSTQGKETKVLDLLSDVFGLIQNDNDGKYEDYITEYEDTLYITGFTISVMGISDYYPNDSKLQEIMLCYVNEDFEFLNDYFSDYYDISDFKDIDYILNTLYEHLMEIKNV